MPVAIKGSGGGSVTLTAAAAAADTTLTLPNTSGTVALTASPTFSGTVTATTVTSPASTALTIQSAGTTAMTVDTSQNVGIGTTNFSATNTNGIVVLGPTGSTTISVGHINGTSNGSTYYYMLYNGAAIGSISQNGTTAVSYNTTSDYRLKENVASMMTGLATVKALKPVTYNWISDKSAGEGFIAHELQAVIPHAVTGEKDTVNEDGSIKPQGVDYSKIVAHLVAAIQELSAKNDALEAANAAFEARLSALEAI